MAGSSTGISPAYIWVNARSRRFATDEGRDRPRPDVALEFATQKPSLSVLSTTCWPFSISSSHDEGGSAGSRPASSRTALLANTVNRFAGAVGHAEDAALGS